MRIVAALAQGRNYVSRLAREIGMSRPLLHMHLQRLEAAGIVVGSLELSDSGKAMKFFEVAPFAYALTPQVVAEAAGSLTDQVQDEKAQGEPEATGDGREAPPDPQAQDEKERAQ
ncbi:ArsR/SmtB family transcription factor [Streptomyces sp. 8N114]|uniref:ArsR/SmtB family transcription factor n=1 Tax=Streptomyces sp. 8N114 TaxID=3457419 RepID=UPI003FD47B0E